MDHKILLLTRYHDPCEATKHVCVLMTSYAESLGVCDAIRLTLSIKVCEAQSHACPTANSHLVPLSHFVWHSMHVILDKLALASLSLCNLTLVIAQGLSLWRVLSVQL